jgi:surfactin synthase thioesterase subunit
METVTLFCLPYAGGSSLIFNKWEQFLDPRVKLRPVELAGRGKRIFDPYYKNIDEAVEDVLNSIRKELGESNYALFGHSMGSSICYKLAQKIQNENLFLPLHLFFSGRRAPHLKRTDEKMYHLMSDDIFKKEIRELGGTPPEFFDHPELMALFLPLLKNDFRIAELDQPVSIRPLDCDISVFLGKDDDLSDEECSSWRHHTRRCCTLQYFNGGHFFLHQEAEQLVSIINQQLCMSKN